MAKQIFQKHKVVIKKIKPLMDGVMTTARRYPRNMAVGENTGIQDVVNSGQVMPIQEVVALSDNVAKDRGLKVGDMVAISFVRFVHVFQKRDSLRTVEQGVDEFNASAELNLPIMKLNDEEHLLLRFSDIDYVIEDYEIIKD